MGTTPSGRRIVISVDVTEEDGKQKPRGKALAAVMTDLEGVINAYMGIYDPHPTADANDMKRLRFFKFLTIKWEEE